MNQAEDTAVTKVNNSPTLIALPLSWDEIVNIVYYLTK